MTRLRVATALLLLAASACADQGGAFECRPTVARMSPPKAFYDFMLNGFNDRAMGEAALENVSFYGNDAIWIILPPNGELVGRLDDKIYSYRLAHGYIRYEARRLDASGSVARRPVNASDYGDIGFQAGGIELPQKGCWGVTYLLVIDPDVGPDTSGRLDFTLRVR